MKIKLLEKGKQDNIEKVNELLEGIYFAQIDKCCLDESKDRILFVSSFSNDVLVVGRSDIQVQRWDKKSILHTYKNIRKIKSLKIEYETE